MASKIEAFFGRGIDEPRFSSDLEDIVTVLSDALNFNEVLKDSKLKPYFNISFNKIFDEPSIVEAINGFLMGPVSGRYEFLLKRVKSLSDLSD